jgi:hypothetical protein
MNRNRVGLIGAAVLGTYLVVAVATLGLSGRRLLPLFEGVGPPPPYQWVHPPAAFSAGNVKPAPVAIDIAIQGGHSTRAAASTPDGQIVVNFTADAFPAHGNDSRVHVAITPHDPATLGPVPPGLAADGNAYRVALTYEPSNTPVDTLATSSDIAMTAPIPGHALLSSSDGRTWSKLAATTVATTSTIIATFKHPGWYLVGANPSAIASGQHRNRLRSIIGTAVVALLVAGLAVALAATTARRRRFRDRWWRRQTPTDVLPSGDAPRARRQPGSGTAGRRRRSR